MASDNPNCSQGSSSPTLSAHDHGSPHHASHSNYEADFMDDLPAGTDSGDSPPASSSSQGFGGTPLPSPLALKGATRAMPLKGQTPPSILKKKFVQRKHSAGKLTLSFNIHNKPLLNVTFFRDQRRKLQRHHLPRRDMWNLGRAAGVM